MSTSNDLHDDSIVTPAADAGPRQPDTHFEPRLVCKHCGKVDNLHSSDGRCLTNRTLAAAPVPQEAAPELGTCYYNSDEHTLNTHGPKFPCQQWVPTTAPDSAMRVARLLHKSKCRACEAGEEIDAYCYKGILADAALIREAGSERERVEPKSLWGWPIDEIKSAMRQWQSKHGSKLPTEFEHECREASRLPGGELNASVASRQE